MGGGSAGGVVPGAGFGSTVSFAVTVVLFPLASVAVNFTVVVPTGKKIGCVDADRGMRIGDVAEVTPEGEFLAAVV